MKEPIKLNSLAGGIDIDAATGKDVNISGGQITIASKTNEAAAFSVTTNQGYLKLLCYKIHKVQMKDLLN